MLGGVHNMAAAYCTACGQPAPAPTRHWVVFKLTPHLVCSLADNTRKVGSIFDATAHGITQRC